MDSFLNVKRLAEVLVSAALGQAERKLGSFGISEHVPAIVDEGLSYLNLPSSVELPLHIRLFGQMALATYQRNQQIQESHRRARENADNIT